MLFNINKIKHRKIEDPYLNVVLFQPEIPFNTGNIARLCGAAEVRMHLIHPLGFKVDDKHLKRAGLDYWQEVDICHHQDFRSFCEAMDAGRRLFAFSRHARPRYPEANVSRGDYLLFGQETKGLPSGITSSYPCFSIPIWGKVRSLNLSSCVGIVTYHYLHHMDLF